MAACKIEKTSDFINKSKLNLFIRLCENNTTKRILEYQIDQVTKKKKTQINSLMSEIIQITDIREESINSLDEVIERVCSEITKIKRKFKELRAEKYTKDIQDCLKRPNEKNRRSLIEMTKPERQKSTNASVQQATGLQLRSTRTG